MSRHWRVGILKDMSQMVLGLHGMHVAFRGLPDVEVIGLADANTDNLADKLDLTQAQRHYPTLEAMLADGAPDVVVLCNRHPYDHLAQIQACAEAGCHIYCEKPLAATLTEADRIVALAEEHRIVIGMAHPCRNAPPFRTLKRLVEEGAIGRPLTVYGRGKCDHRGGGEDLIVLGTHILDYETCLFGSPSQVWAEVTTEGRPIVATDRDKTVEPIGPAAGDSIFASFRFANEVRGLFESRRGLFDPATGVIHMGVTVSGTEGSLSLRFKDLAPPAAKLRLSRYPGPPEDESSYQDVPVTEDRVIPGAEPLDYSVCGRESVPTAVLFIEAGRFAAWDLLQAIEEGRQPNSSAYDARRTQEMLQGIYASALSGSAVALPLVERAHPLGE